MADMGSLAATAETTPGLLGAQLQPLGSDFVSPEDLLRTLDHTEAMASTELSQPHLLGSVAIGARNIYESVADNTIRNKTFRKVAVAAGLVIGGGTGAPSQAIAQELPPPSNTPVVYPSQPPGTPNEIDGEEFRNPSIDPDNTYGIGQEMYAITLCHGISEEPVESVLSIKPDKQRPRTRVVMKLRLAEDPGCGPWVDREYKEFGVSSTVGSRTRQSRYPERDFKREPGQQYVTVKTDLGQTCKPGKMVRVRGNTVTESVSLAVNHPAFPLFEKTTARQQSKRFSYRCKK